jgi:GNAT superfamily N-acetyltransferase
MNDAETRRQNATGGRSLHCENLTPATLEDDTGVAASGFSLPSLPRAADLGLELRVETEADGPFTTRLYASTRSEELAQVPWSEAEKATFLGLQHEAQHQHYRLHYADANWFVVEHRGAAIGRLYFIRWARELRIIDIALLPEARRKGFGAALLGDLIDEAQSAGKPVSIHVERMNPALSLYRRLGFELVEDKGVYLLLERPPLK